MTRHTGRDVVQMAIDMERVGQAFYEALAGGCDNPKISALCVRLARAEAAHGARFKVIFDSLPNTTAGLPISETQRAEAERWIASHVLPSPTEVQKVGLGGSIKDAVAMAVKMESDSIRFYNAMLKLIPSGHAEIGEIIREEESHLRDLQMSGG